jgi:hypothetical protein
LAEKTIPQAVSPPQIPQQETFPTLLERTLDVVDRVLGKMRLNELPALFAEGRL